jgi:hypothetical protein
VKPLGLPPPKSSKAKYIIMQEVKDGVMQILQYMRVHSQEPLEFEVRVGRYDDAGEFLAGYDDSATLLVDRMVKRLKSSVEQDHTRWRMLDVDNMLRADYGQGIRHTAHQNQEQQYVQKSTVDTKWSTMDVLCHNRPMWLRFRLAREDPIDLTRRPDLQALLKQKAPLSVRYIRRQSFLETVMVGEEKVVFRYDISKVSASGKTKLEATNGPSRYHVELELVSKLHTWSEKEQETKQNMAVADAFLDRAKALLGSFVVDGVNRFALLPAQLSMLHESQRNRRSGTKP